ncbi:MAG: sugar-binding domain-containing protein [Candidatus Limnocylindria bacterium]
MQSGRAEHDRLSLRGDWAFELDPGGELSIESLRPTRTIRVPLPWQAAFPELRRYSGYAWYQRVVDLPPGFARDHARLRFGAVDYWCQVFVNGTLVGEHEGGYTPFDFPVGRQLRSGPNTITVRVFDAVQDAIVLQRWPDFQAQMNAASSGPPFDPQHIPHGKQEVYVNVGGIWQDVTLTAGSMTRFASVHVTPLVEAGAASVDVRLAGELDRIDGVLVVSIFGADRATPVASAQLRLSAGASRYETLIEIPKPHPWSVDDPFLYLARATLRLRDGNVETSVRFGMRSFRARDGQFLLNDEPFYLIAALDQDLYPETIFTVPSVAYLRDEFRMAKELGFNCLRCHLKVPDPVYLDIADEVGLLVWAELPSWRTFWPKGTVHPHQLDMPGPLRERVEATLDAMIDRDFNHPSLVARTLVNEDWGTALSLSSDDRRWLADLYDRCKRADPTRLVVDNSACGAPWGPNFHVKSDVDDFHLYAGIPDQLQAFERAIDELALRPLWTFSAHGDATRTGNEPIVLSEFGSWGLPSLASLHSDDGKHPAWLQIGPWGSGWEVEPGWPSGAAERFERYGLDAIWADFETFSTATQRHQYSALKLQIETVRRQRSLAGYVVTQLADSYWESNGLIDFTRRPKACHAAYAVLNSPTVVIGVPHRRALMAGDGAVVDVHISHYAQQSREPMTLRWRLGDAAGGDIPIEPIAPGATVPCATLRFRAPEVTTPETTDLQLYVYAHDGAELARSTVELALYPLGTGPRWNGLVAHIDGAAAEPLWAEDRGQNEISRAEMVESQTEPIVSQPSLEQAWSERQKPAWGGRSALGSRMRAVGYRVTDRLTPDVGLAVTSAPTPELLEWVRRGGDLLFLSEGNSPFFWAQARSGVYGGSWISAFNWARPDVHARLSVSNPLGLPYARVMPQHTVLGLPLEDGGIHDDILAGMVIGWVRHPGAHTVRFQYGRGRVVMTTFRLAANVADDAIATLMLHDLVDHLASSDCRPTLTANY